MTASDPDIQIDPARVLATDADLQDQLERLLQRASVRQVWLLFLDGDLRLAEPLMPNDEVPDSPHELCDTEDLGTVPFAEVLVDRARMASEMIGAREFVLVWERCGADRFSAEDRAWAHAAAAEAGPRWGRGASFGGETPVPLRAQFVLHDTGLRQITADDYA
ncbi:MAG: hypothetical protein QM606_02750 [Leucobacter sp.]